MPPKSCFSALTLIYVNNISVVISVPSKCQNIQLLLTKLSGGDSKIRQIFSIWTQAYEEIDKIKRQTKEKIVNTKKLTKVCLSKKMFNTVSSTI